jgi:hypothetical protein
MLSCRPGPANAGAPVNAGVVGVGAIAGRLTPTCPSRRPAVRAAAARPSGRGRSAFSGAADAAADAPAAAVDAAAADAPKRSPKKAARGSKSSSSTAAAADAEAAARELLETGADLAAEAVGAAAGAAEAARDVAFGAADDALAAAEGLVSSAARGAEEAAGDFVFATASMADAAAAALQEVVGGPAASLAASSSANAATGAPRPPTTAAAPVLSAQELKRELVQSVAGLDRGLGASLREARAVDALARRLERAAPAAAATEGDGGADDDPAAAASARRPPLAPGCWRLIWSSAFGGGSLGGSRPGPPAALTPFVLGGVFQVVDRERGTLDNVVELLAPSLAGASALAAAPLRALSAALGGGGGGGGDDDDDDDPTPGVRLTLRHDYEILGGGGGGGDGATTVRIVFENTFARALGPAFLASRLPRLAAPSLPEPLRPPRGLRAATFSVTYEDAEMRVTRGDRGELRVFLREAGRGLDAAPLSAAERAAAPRAGARRDLAMSIED